MNIHITSDTNEKVCLLVLLFLYFYFVVFLWVVLLLLFVLGFGFFFWGVCTKKRYCNVFVFHK